LKKAVSVLVTSVILLLGGLVLSSRVLSGEAQTRSVVSISGSDIRNDVQQVRALNVGDNFTVYVWVDKLVGALAAQVQFTYDRTVLNATSIQEGPFLPSFGPTIIPQSYAVPISDTLGEVYFSSAMTTNTSASGSGVLLNVTFTVLSEGSSKLHLLPFFPSGNCPGTYFIDMNLNSIVPNLGDGFYNTPVPSIHDVAVISVMPSKTVAGRGYPMDLSVIVANQGGYTEAFNVTAYAKATVMGVGEVTALPAAYSTQLILEWNTTGLSYGNYSLFVYAWPVPNETSTDNNNCTGDWVIVTIPGDINGDFKATLADLVALAHAYGSKPADSNWNSSADIDGNGTVGLSDLVALAQHYGQHYP
jgi:hypothetical protein